MQYGKRANGNLDRLVINCRYLTRPSTGVERFAYEMTRQIIKRRPETRLIAPSRQLRLDSIAGIPVKKVGRLNGHAWEQLEVPLNLAPGELLLNLANTGPVVNRQQLTVIHDITWSRYPSSYSRSFRTAYRILTPLLYKRSQFVATVSEFSRRDLADAFGGRASVEVIPNAVSDDLREIHKAKPPADLPSRYFLIVGSLNEHKNLRTVLEAYRLAEARRIALPPLLVVGGTSNAFASGLGSGGRDVHMLGRVTDEQLGWLYTNAEAFVFPSLYEGFGLPPLEAQALGIPVLSSNAASLPEVLGAGAIYFDPSSPDDALRALVEINVKSDHQELIADGLANAGRYSWATSAAKLMALLEQGWR